MISEIPLTPLIVVLAALIGLFFVMRSFKMPASFEKNRKKREDVRRQMAKFQEIMKTQEMTMGPDKPTNKEPPKNKEAPRK
jgi:hypothetical protein